jgi:hypothetical protein
VFFRNISKFSDWKLGFVSRVFACKGHRTRALMENIFGFVEPYQNVCGIRAEFESPVRVADTEETKLLMILDQEGVVFHCLATVDMYLFRRSILMMRQMFRSLYEREIYDIKRSAEYLLGENKHSSGSSAYW